MPHTTASSVSVAVVCPSNDERISELKEVLVRIGYAVRIVRHGEHFPKIAHGEMVVCLFRDAPSSRKQHQQFLRMIRARPVLAVVAKNTVDDCEPLIDNCSDFCGWPCPPDEIELRISRLLRMNKQSNVRPVSQTPNDNPLHKLVGDSPNFINSIKQIHRVAPFDAPVLITGETGTGKEIVARAIHYEGARRDGPFIPVNCGALPENLIENELFGHDKGAFTDASKARPGLLHQADGGTLFLDEVDALPINRGQTALLRVLEDREYRPLGAGAAVSVDVRIIAASNTRLATLVDEAAFRADLFYRLNILRIKLPPLRQRGRDVALLSDHFLKCFSAQYGLEKRISLEGLDTLLNYSWPGNVRELQNFLHREYLQQEETVLGCNSLAEKSLPLASLRAGRAVFDRTVTFCKAKDHAISEFERQYLVHVISESSGNISEAARLAGKERRALGRLLKKHNIDAATYRGGQEMGPAQIR